jgi:hypothetical protein
MEGVIFKAFGVVFQTVGILLFAGVMASVLTDLNRHAFESKQRGLTSMLKVNEQLVGKTR